MSVAFVTLAVGTRGRELLAISGPSLRDWAKSLRATFHVIDRAPAGYPLAGKFHLSRIVAKFDRTLFVDADVIPNVAAMPNILDLVPADAVAMHDDLPHVAETGWANDLFGRLADSQGWNWTGPARQMLNTGVIVASRQHAELFAPPKRSFPAEHCSEQFLIQLAIERAGVRTHALDSRWNFQWWFKRSMPSLAERPDLFVRHFAGTSQPQVFKTTHRDRLRMMRSAVRELAGEPSREGRKCLHLGRRLETRPGCATGWGCRHACEKGLPAIPGGTCQTCDQFDDDGRF